jgi:hypothetical protein
VNVPRDNIKSTLTASNRVGLNAEKTKNMLLSRHHNAGQDREIKIANRSFENMA